MKRFSKVSFDDIKTIQVDSGVLLKKFDVENPVFLPENVICATSGGINPVCAPEYYDFSEDVDNAKQSKETKRIRGWNATISFTTFTTSLDLIRLALGAADISGKVLSIRQKLQYAKDFKDIWWVGERADGIVVAIKLIRSLSDSGFSLQTNKRGKGQISITLKGHSSFSDKNKIPMEIYVIEESNEPVIPDVPVVPDTPVTASLYLYGTPSKVKYNGVELPDIEAVWTDKETYPYAFIQTAGTDSACVRFSTVQPYTDGTYIRSTNASYMEYDLSSDKTEWVFYKSKTEYTGSHFDVANFLWSNCDIADSSGTVQFAASEPVHSGNIGLRVGESVTYYDGGISPMWDKDTYPFAGAYYHDNTEYRAFYFFAHTKQNYFEDKSLVTTRYYGTPQDSDIPDGVTWIRRGENSEWESLGKAWNVSTDIGSTKKEYNGLWTNFDLYYSDGTLMSAASAPIPVTGEIVEYINGIPIYEVKT